MAMKKGKSLGQYHSSKTGYLYMAPFLVLFTVFVIAPVIIVLALSFTNYNMLQAPSFVGLQNYERLFLEDDIFSLAISNTFVFALFIGPLTYCMSFFMAWLLNNRRFENALSLCFYVPSITSSIAMTTVWLYLFSNDRAGLINNLLLTLGFIRTPIYWNQSAQYIFPVVILISVWMGMGTGFLVFLAGLKNMPEEVFEAGRIDGLRNKWQALFYLTIPLMKPQLLFGAINSIVGSFAVFDVAVQFAGMPSPNYAAHTIVAHLFDSAFFRFQMGYASAIAVILFAITFILGQICMRVFRSDD